MKNCMITFRSITPAQRGQLALQRAGIGCYMRRTPQKLRDRGCGYSLNLPCAHMLTGVELLRSRGIAYQKVYLLRPDGEAEEVAL